MTEDDLRTLAPGAVVHYETWPEGCSPWKARHTWDDTTLGRMVDFDANWLGGGSPTLHARSHDLNRYHLATKCAERTVERVAEAAERARRTA